MTNEKVRPITNRPTTVADHCSALYPLGLHDVLMPCNIISTVYMHLTADKHQMCLIQISPPQSCIFNIAILQGSSATDLRRGDMFYFILICTSLLNARVRELSRAVNINKVMVKIKVTSILWPKCRMKWPICGPLVLLVSFITCDRNKCTMLCLTGHGIIMGKH